MSRSLQSLKMNDLCLVLLGNYYSTVSNKSSFHSASPSYCLYHTRYHELLALQHEIHCTTHKIPPDTFFYTRDTTRCPYYFIIYRQIPCYTRDNFYFVRYRQIAFLHARFRQIPSLLHEKPPDTFSYYTGYFPILILTNTDMTIYIYIHIYI